MRHTILAALAGLTIALPALAEEPMCEQSTSWEHVHTGDRLDLDCEGQSDTAFAIIVRRNDGSLAVVGRADTIEDARASAEADARRIGGTVD